MNKLGMAKIALIVLPFIMTSSCGKQDESNNGSGNRSPELTLTPSEQLANEWTGIYRALEDGKPFGDAASATAVFQTSGNFSVSLDNDSAARIEGIWSEFQGKTLILKITGSTMPRIGITGKVVEPNYELLGSSLRIANNTFELKLSKKANSNSGNANDSVRFGFSGSWLCKDNTGRKTKIIVSDAAEFKMSSVGPEERAFVTQGTIVNVAGNSLRLKPVISSDPLPAETYFELQQSGINAELTIFRAGRPPMKLGTCKK